MSKPRHVLRYHFAATISGEVDYDMADPASYTKALEAVSEKHRQLAAMGAVITKDARKPVVVKVATPEAQGGAVTASGDGLEIPPAMRRT